MRRIITPLLLFILTATIASAELMYVESGTAVNAAGYGNAGVSFQVTESIEVTELSFFGLSLGGADTPLAQLWNADTNTQLGIVNWAGGEAGAGWNSKALASSVTLNTGVNYQIQAVAYWVPRYADDTSFTFGSEISNPSFHHDAGWGGWTAPTATIGGAALTSDLPNMVNFTYNTIPEPSTWIMTLSGMGLLLVAMRRRK